MTARITEGLTLTTYYRNLKVYSGGASYPEMLELFQSLRGGWWGLICQRYVTTIRVRIMWNLSVLVPLIGTS